MERDTLDYARAEFAPEGISGYQHVGRSHHTRGRWWRFFEGIDYSANDCRLSPSCRGRRPKGSEFSKAAGNSGSAALGIVIDAGVRRERGEICE